ncbi:MAG TPA: PAS domain S-box protein [Opitutaceae bacterium]|jgi:PAS domain S-box-containing protein|nr:PAS domain S-box protein [Opitutaceae bacterium]
MPCHLPVLPAEELLRAIIDSSDDAIVSKDLNGTITSWNQSAERIFGFTQDEALGHSIMMLLPVDRPDEEKYILERIRRGDRIDHFETKRRRKDGQLIDVSVTISPIRASDGSVVGASKVARDITEQKRSGRAASLLAAIVSSSDAAIISKDLEGIITSWNVGAERMYGYTAEEVVGKSVLLLVPADRKQEEATILERIRNGERLDHFETLRQRKNGEIFPVSLTISPVKDSRGAIVGASKIARDITELKRISSEREQLLASERTARTQAEVASRMKDDFLATVSHELRTPLNAIVGWAQVLKESEIRPDILEGVETIERNAHAQAQLIDDLLDLGRISSGNIMLNIHPIDLVGVIRDAIDSVRHAADAKQITIRTVFNASSGLLTGDKNRLQQVLWNLLANAIKFTQKGGRVMVTTEKIHSHLEIVVSDNGAGITSDFLPHVFDRFRQADPSTTRRAGGLGIGLALVKHLVELHGGEVRAESLGINQGATFTVSLPVAALKLDTPAEGISQRLALPSAEDLGGIKILVVDDDQDSLEVVRRILSTRNATVQTANTVDHALILFPSLNPDVILSDIGMPDADGYELIRRIREMPDGRNVPAVALTALARSEDRMMALNAGFQTHLAKPIAPGELVATVRSLTTFRNFARNPAL